MYDCTGRITNAHFDAQRSYSKTSKVIVEKCIAGRTSSEATVLPVTAPFVAFDTVSTGSAQSQGVEQAIEILKDSFTQLTNHTEQHVSGLRRQIHLESAALCKLVDTLNTSLEECRGRLDSVAAPVQVDRTVVQSIAQAPGVSALLVLLPVSSPEFSASRVFSMRFAMALSPGHSPVLALKCNGDNHEECTVLETSLPADGTTHIIGGTITHSFAGLECSLNTIPFVGSVRLPFQELHTVELYVASELDAAVTLLETTIDVQRTIQWVSTR